MSGHSGGPKGETLFVTTIKISSCGTFAYQCRSDCTIACTGGDACNGNKFPVARTQILSPDVSSSQVAVSPQAAVPSSPIASPPTTPEINRVLKAPLDLNSPSTQEFLKGNFL